MKATVSTTSNFWIARNALTIQLNAMGDPDYVQVSVVSGAVIMCFIDGVIGFDSGHNYRRWAIVAYPTVFENDQEKFIYARIPNDEISDSNEALITYSSLELDLYGRELSQSEEELTETPEYYYVYLGHISETTAGSARVWLEDLIDSGTLSTDQYIQEETASDWRKMFELNSESDSIIAKLPIISAIVRTLKIGTGEKAITDVKRSVDTDTDVPVADTNVTTSKYVAESYLSRKKNDTASGKITFEKGAEFGSFLPGMVGDGGKIDEHGHGEMRSLRLWESLEVPELRYNRVSVYIGIRMDTFGGGIIESVAPDTQHAGAGTATLKLEDGEYGAVEEGDLMMGIWHDEGGGNSTETSDNHLGDFSFAGFKTVYFVITGVSGSRNEEISYMLRASFVGGNGFHPFSGMHFAGRGNIHAEKKNRQSFTYSTTEYAVSLTGVTTWDFKPEHYYEIHGNLDGFKMPAVNRDGGTYIKEFHGQGQVFGNAYIFGEIDSFERLSFVCLVNQSHNGFLMPGESETVTVTVLNGYGADVTTDFRYIRVTRNTGDAASDDLWNSKPEHQQATNPFAISFNDLGIDGIRQVVAVFEVVASDEANHIAAQPANLEYYI